MSESKPRTRGRIPAWLALPLIVMALAAGAWVLYRLYPSTSAGLRPVAVVPEIVPGEGPFDQKKGRFFARRNGTRLYAVPRDEGGYTAHVDYDSSLQNRWVNKQQYELHQLAINLLRTAAMARDIDLTPEQRKALASLRYNMPVTPEQQQQLADLLQAWEQAPRPQRGAAAEKLLATLAAIGKEHEAATRAAWQNRVTQIPKILSAEQIKKAREWRPDAKPQPKPAPQPAASKPEPAAKTPATKPAP